MEATEGVASEGNRQRFSVRRHFGEAHLFPAARLPDQLHVAIHGERVRVASRLDPDDGLEKAVVAGKSAREGKSGNVEHAVSVCQALLTVPSDRHGKLGP
jgi:hypothetical protein